MGVVIVTVMTMIAAVELAYHVCCDVPLPTTLDGAGGSSRSQCCCCCCCCCCWWWCLHQGRPKVRLANVTDFPVNAVRVDSGSCSVVLKISILACTVPGQSNQCSDVWGASLHLGQVGWLIRPAYVCTLGRERCDATSVELAGCHPAVATASCWNTSTTISTRTLAFVILATERVLLFLCMCSVYLLQLS